MAAWTGTACNTVPYTHSLYVQAVCELYQKLFEIFASELDQ